MPLTDPFPSDGIEPLGRPQNRRVSTRLRIANQQPGPFKLVTGLHETPLVARSGRPGSIKELTKTPRRGIDKDRTGKPRNPIR
ncbi:hypothetical protein D3C72_1062580 [compost metagenome]